MPTCHLIHGEKGGCGKTTATMAACTYLAGQQIPYHLVDADRSNPKLAGAYREAQRVPFIEDPELTHCTDALFLLVMERTTVVDLPAQAQRPLDHWLETRQVLEVGQDFGVNFQIWWMCDGGKDSVQQFLKCHRRWGEQIRHVFVKNRGMSRTWEYVDTHEPLQELLSRHQIPVLSFPKLDGQYRALIEQAGQRFEEAIASGRLGPLGAQVVKVFLKRVSEDVFEPGGLVPVQEEAAA